MDFTAFLRFPDRTEFLRKNQSNGIEGAIALAIILSIMSLFCFYKALPKSMFNK
jgi:hypothetical protein